MTYEEEQVGSVALQPDEPKPVSQPDVLDDEVCETCNI